MEFVKTHNKMDRLLLCNNIFGYHIIWKRTLIYTTERKLSIDKCFGPMFIDFDEYPHYSGRESIIFEKYLNEDIKCEHGYAYSASQRAMYKWVNEDTWEMRPKFLLNDNFFSFV